MSDPASPRAILIVDDYPEFAGMLQGRLTAEGYRVSVALDGPGGIEKAKTQKPDLIILDIMMPDVGGTEVRVELMKDPVTRDIPILFLTGLRAPRSKRKALNASIRIIGKSNDFKELLDAIQEIFNKTSKI